MPETDENRLFKGYFLLTKKDVGIITSAKHVLMFSWRKKVKICSNDKQYITSQLKKLIRYKINLLKNDKTSEANSLCKHIKKEIRKSASSYYQYKVKGLFSTKPKQWYNRKKYLLICTPNPQVRFSCLASPLNCRIE